MSAQPPTPTASPRFSLKGWSAATWLTKNAGFVKKTLTTALTASGGIVVSDLATLKHFALIWGLAFVALAASAVLDVVHYFLSENPS